MKQLRTIASVAAVAALATPTLAAAAPSRAPVSMSGVATLDGSGPVKHQFTVRTESLRGLTLVCRDLTLRVTRGTSTERTDADLRNGVARLSISRTGHHVRLHGSDGRNYRASSFTIAWFVLHDPDFDTPVNGLEVSQIMLRGGPDKSPGWLRERIAWTDKHETESVTGPCDFAG
jgi:hypothetical protein